MSCFWSRRYSIFSLTSVLVMGGALASLGDCAIAQIVPVPDNTLGANNSTVTPISPTLDQIDGGATRGANLFHSFQEFNIGGGRSVFFTNPVGIENILTRVTGSNPSNILGTLGVTGGNANLFLINPNGIIFGLNARLSIGGSFVASTASSLNFADGTQFSATNSQGTVTLTSSVPLGLQFGATPGNIRSQGANLSVPSGKTLALVGGNLTLEGGSLSVAGGRLELGSVGGNSLVNLAPVSNGWALGYDGVQNFQDIQLSQGSVVNATEPGGTVTVAAKELRIQDGSSISTSTSSAEEAGDLTVRASESVELSGTLANRQVSNLTAQTFGAGAAGNLTIDTKRLLVRDGAFVSTTTFGAGNAGILTIRASESVEVSGTVPLVDGSRGSGLFAQVNSQNAIGNGGILTIETGKLIVRDGATVSAPTLGRGNAGELRIRASDSVELNNGQLTTEVGQGAEGRGGDLTIDTGKLTVQNGGQVFTSTSGIGNAGELRIHASESIELAGSGSVLRTGVDQGAEGNGGTMTIDTRRLTIRDGARLSTSTFGNGKAGDMTIRASESIDLTGSGSVFFAQVLSGAQGDGGTMTINTRRLTVRDGAQLTTSTFGNGKAGDLIIQASESVDLNRGSLFATAQPGATGNGGNLTINTGELKIQNGATVNVSSQGAGRAGNLNITAHSIELNRGTLRAETSSGKGGDITLNAQDLLLLRNGSQISTNAGIPDTPGEGGNITINAPDGFIVAVPIENSDITANAFGRQGGRVSITVQDIFGIQSRDNLTPDSDITASSDIGINGQIIIQKLSFDISRGLVELPQEVINPEDLIASRCSTARRRTPSRFVDTGRGSLPPNPIDAIGEGATPQSRNIVEAQGWIRVNGKVKLTNQVPMAQPYSSWETPSACSDDTR